MPVPLQTSTTPAPTAPTYFPHPPPCPSAPATFTAPLRTFSDAGHPYCYLPQTLPLPAFITTPDDCAPFIPLVCCTVPPAFGYITPATLPLLGVHSARLDAVLAFTQLGDLTSAEAAHLTVYAHYPRTTHAHLRLVICASHTPAGGCCNTLPDDDWVLCQNGLPVGRW